NRGPLDSFLIFALPWNSHLRREQRSDPSFDFLAPRPLPPIVQGNLTGMALVVFKDFRMRGDELPIEHVQVCLLVQRQGTVIKIRRTDGSPAIIHEKVFTVKPRRLVFVKAGARFQQSPPTRFAYCTNHLSIDIRPRRDDFNLYATPERVEQGF